MMWHVAYAVTAILAKWSPSLTNVKKLLAFACAKKDASRQLKQLAS
jgi:hypothetical protein